MSDEQMLQMIMGRLDRFEHKMDSMAEAVTSLARAEERIAGQAATLRTMQTEITQIRKEEIKPLKDRVRTLERCVWRMTGISTTVAAGTAIAVPILLKWLLP